MILAIEQKLGYRFSNADLLEEALTHPSCNRQKEGQLFHYQRLEFLGDSVLGLVISDLLIKHFPQEPEGSLARRKAALVESKALAEIMRQWNIADLIYMSAGEEASGGRDSQSILEDVCEALLGAVYRDGGYIAAYAVIEKFWQPMLELAVEAPKDAKTALQEWVQAQGLPLPIYTVISSEGPAHEPLFVVSVSVKNYESEQAEASSKRKAEQLAAAKMLGRIES